jgi:hypothetical protein
MGFLKVEKFGLIKLDRQHTGRLRKKREKLRREEAWEEPNHMMARKPGPL